MLNLCRQENGNEREYRYVSRKHWLYQADAKRMRICRISFMAECTAYRHLSICYHSARSAHNSLLIPNTQMLKERSAAIMGMAN